MWLLAGFGFVVLVSLGAILYSQVFPAAPRIVATRQLSHTRLQKSPDMECYLATDGSRVYYSEHRSGDRWVLSQVSVAGGESADLPSQPPEFAIYGSWLSGTELITARCCPNKLFAMPLPAGAPRPLDIPAGATWFAPIPDGSGVVYAFNGDKEMHRLKLPENVHTKLLSDRDVTWTRVSPDGKRIRWTSAGADGGMWEMGIEGSNPQPLPLPDGSHFGDWTSDGKLFFFLRWEKNATTLWAKREDSRFSLIKSKPVLLYAGPLELHSPVASTNSKELYAIGVDLRGELSVYEPSRFVPFLGGIPANYVSFSHDGKWIAYVSYPDGNLWRSRIDGSEKLQLTFNTSVFTPRWSPDDKLISFASSGFEYGAIYVISPEGGKPSLLLSGPERPADPTWSPDGKSIAYGGDLYSKPHSKVRILTLETMQSRDVPGSEGLFSPRWSPDGKYIVAHHTKKLELLLYSFTEQKWRPLLQGEWVGWEAWSHDSKYVYAFSATKNCIFRVEIKTGKIETIVSLEGIAWTNSGFRNAGWFDLTPEDRIMILRNTGTEEIYALQLEY